MDRLPPVTRRSSSRRVVNRRAAAPIGLARALGLTAGSSAEVDGARAERLAEAAALWPMAVGALAFAPALLVALALADGDRAQVTPLLVVGLPSALAALVVLALYRLPGWRDAAPHRRIAGLTAAGTVAAVSLSLLLASSGALALPAARLAAFVAICGAFVIVVIALGAIRAAALAFAATLGLMVPVILGLGVASAAAMVLVALLLVGVMGVARTDLSRLADRRAAESAGRIAIRLVAEYEVIGSGWFWQTDRHGAITYLSPKVAAELAAIGVDTDDALLVDVLRVDSEQGDTERTLQFHFSSRTAFSGYSVRAVAEGAGADGGGRGWSISGRPVNDALGRFQGFVGSGADLSEKRRSEAEITRLALFDALTGLANRQRMRQSLDQTLAQKGTGLTALFLLDLDRFKAVNDTLGHQTGDELLKQVAQRLQRSIGEKGLVGRLGGDEFQVILPGEGNRDVLGQLAKAVIGSLSQPYFINGSSIAIGCSIGIAVAPDHGADAETLVQHADLALYAAKAAGRGVHRFYREELLAGAKSRKRLEDDLRHAIAQDQLHLAYQPVVATADEQIVGYEALLRWDHPTRGPISPAEFIPVAEECGLIEQIGEWALRTAVHAAAGWPGGTRVAVNVSPIQFANPRLPAIVAAALADAGLAPERLELEITEGVFLDNIERAQVMFDQLKKLRVRLALDDFGTGYSSLGYLKTAPFDKIKIDQSFVRGAIEPGNRNAAIIRAIVALAQTLHMETTAEGAEQQDEIALIGDLGCSHIQGYVYGRPAEAAVVAEQLAAGGGRATAVGYRVSRAARTTTLRSARMAIAGEEGEVRLRNVSAGGAMIDGLSFPPDAVGVDCLIELIENQLVGATVRWTDGERAGIEFSEAFDMDRLGAAAPVKPGRRAA